GGGGRVPGRGRLGARPVGGRARRRGDGAPGRPGAARRDGGAGPRAHPPQPRGAARDGGRPGRSGGVSAAGRAASTWLAPLGAAFGLGAAVRVGLYRRGWLRQARLSGPVISVGNLSVGGSGKT